MTEKKKKLTQKKIKKQMINKLENKKVILKQGMISKKQSKQKESNDLIKKHIFYRI